jgi:hypothetical protein
MASRYNFPQEEEMKTRRIAVWAAWLGFAGILMACPSFAQQGTGAGRMYDPKTVETVKGEVVSVEKIPSPGGKGSGVHLMLKTDKETVSVELGPDWHIEKQPVRIQAKDTIEVKGSRVMVQGKAAIIASEVKKGDQSLKLRDENGIPAWSGGGRRPGY